MVMNTDETVDKVKLDPRVDFAAGTVAGIAGLIVGYPFDTVKVRFQSPETSMKYRSTFNALTTIIREERFRGLFKGAVTPMAGCAFLNGLVFSSYGFFMKLQLAADSEEPSLSQIAVAGAGAGIISSVITCPTELIKIRQQGMLSAQPSATAVALDIFRKQGVRGLYRGITATALRDCGFGAYFATYEATCRYFKPPPRTATQSALDHSSILEEVEGDIDRLPWPALLLAGGLAGVNGWLATFAFDVVKTRVQGEDYHTSSSTNASHGSATNPSRPYQTTISTILYSYRTDGLSVFFRGLSPTLIRAIPVNMVVFAVFEGVVNLLS